MTQSLVKPTPAVLASIDDTEPRVEMVLDDNYVAAMIKLHDYTDTYLYIARVLDPRVLAQLRATQAGVAHYADLAARRIGIQIAFGLMFTVIALIVLLSAVWIGLNFANYLVAPIRRLIGAAQIVSTGNLYVQVPTRRSEGDLAQLGQTFNKMTQELRTQRDDIVRARDLIDSRRRFTEAVLAGASAGVIGIDAESCISILNRSAERLIGRSESEALGKPLVEMVPELEELFTTARGGVQRLVQGQVTINRAGASGLSRCASPASRPAPPNAAMWSPSTISPSLSPPSARQPGPMWPVASRTKSKTRSRRSSCRPSACAGSMHDDQG